MDKETIKSYLMSICDYMEECRFIKAYRELKFVLENLKGETLTK